MNTKFQLFVIVIIAVFSLSLNFSVDSKGGGKSGSKSENKEYLVKKTDEKLKGSVMTTETTPEASSPTPETKADSTMIYAYDDGPFHFFRFNRIKRLKKCVKNLCFFTKLFLLCVHIAVLIVEFVHILSH